MTCEQASGNLFSSREIRKNQASEAWLGLHIEQQKEAMMEGGCQGMSSDGVRGQAQMVSGDKLNKNLVGHDKDSGFYSK